MEDLNDLVSTRAYHLWERDGRPHGMHKQHWEQAWREIEAERAVAAESPRVERPRLRRIVLKARYSPSPIERSVPHRVAR